MKLSTLTAISMAAIVGHGQVFADAARTAEASSAASSPDIATPTKATSAASAPEAKVERKDITLDAPAVSPATTASGQAPVAELNELALELLRSRNLNRGHARNQAVSSVSLLASMGLVHAGTSGKGAREIAGLLGSGNPNGKNFTIRWPKAYRDLTLAGQKSGQLSSINRVWVSQGVASALQPTYVAQAKERYAADGALVDFGKPDQAREAINAWVSDATNKQIPELLSAGSVKANTKVMAVNAMHFKAPWELPFEASSTRMEPFQLANGQSKQVATMNAQRLVRAGTIDNITVYELPFAGKEFVLRVAMPPKGHTVQALIADQDGRDMAGWDQQLKPTSCRLSLPKFKLKAETQALKPALRELGVNTVFGQAADFSPMLGSSGKSMQLDNVYQSVSVTIDENGGEASAATAATITAKSMAPMVPQCKVDRPFVFSIVHSATQLPVFVGQISDPSLN